MQDLILHFCHSDKYLSDTFLKKRKKSPPSRQVQHRTWHFKGITENSFHCNLDLPCCYLSLWLLALPAADVREQIVPFLRAAAFYLFEGLPHLPWVFCTFNRLSKTHVFKDSDHYCHRFLQISIFLLSGARDRTYSSITTRQSRIPGFLSFSYLYRPARCSATARCYGLLFSWWSMAPPPSFPAQFFPVL